MLGLLLGCWDQDQDQDWGWDWGLGPGCAKYPRFDGVYSSSVFSDLLWTCPSIIPHPICINLLLSASFFASPEPQTQVRTSPLYILLLTNEFLFTIVPLFHLLNLLLYPPARTHVRTITPRYRASSALVRGETPPNPTGTGIKKGENCKLQNCTVAPHPFSHQARAPKHNQAHQPASTPEPRDAQTQHHTTILSRFQLDSRCPKSPSNGRASSLGESGNYLWGSTNTFFPLQSSYYFGRFPKNYTPARTARSIQPCAASSYSQSFPSEATSLYPLHQGRSHQWVVAAKFYEPQVPMTKVF